MDVSVLVYKNHQNADMEGCDLQGLVYLIYHHSPEKFIQFLMVSFPCQLDLLDHLYISTLSLQYQ